MQTRSLNHSSFSQRASARRRIRRTAGSHRLYCTTNGCTTYMQPDALTHSVSCPICGATRSTS